MVSAGRVYVDTLAEAVLRWGFSLADARDVAEAEAARARAAANGENRAIGRNFISLPHKELRGSGAFSATKP
jgi:hypothetical protein